uniref:Ras-GEF domain-containing protein n=1 Tax=Steinernema glaseri TaxID=37863 RepID=A0A1I7XZ53_9BILA
MSGAQILSPVVNTEDRDSNLNIVNLRPNYASSTLSLAPSELEANYAHVLRPDLQKTVPTFERSLSQQVVLNQAKKQLLRKNIFTSESNLTANIPLSGRISGSVAHLPLSALLNRPLPEPEKSPTTIPEQEDYCEMDYDAMEDPTPMMISSSHSSPSRSASARSSFIQDEDIFSIENPRLTQRYDSSFSLTSVASESAAMNSNLSPFTKTFSCHNLASAKSPNRVRLPTRTDSAPSLPQRLACVDEDRGSVRDSACVPDQQDYDVPLYSTSRVDRATSLVDTKSFRSLYMNKATQQPLAESVVETVKALLHSTDPDALAMMICHEDCRILRLTEPLQTCRAGDNGLVLILLPHGNAIRNDLIERSRCLQFTCLLTILKCKSSHEQAKLLAAYIHMAKKLVFDLGNAFSFVNIMSTLTSKQIESLETMWSLLDHDALQVYESYLIPALKCITKTAKLPTGAKPCVIPFVQPILELMAKNFTCDDPLFFDNSSFAAELDSLWKWLEIAREWSSQANHLREAAKERYGRSTSRTDNIFATEFMMRFLFEFMMRFLFGNQASSIDAPVRYSKMRRLADMLTRQAIRVS